MSMKRKRYYGTNAMAIKTDIAEEFQLEEVRVHLPVAEGTTANMVIGIDAIDSRNDLALSTSAMAAATDVLYQPTRPLNFAAGDEVSIAWANANSKPWAVEIIYQ